MKETSVSIKGIFKWLLHNWLIIICITLAAAFAITGYMAFSFSRSRQKSTTSVHGKIIIKSDGSEQAALLYDSFYAAAYGLFIDESVQRKTAETYGQSGADGGFALSLYKSCVFSYINYGIIPYSYSVSSEMYEDADAALTYLKDSIQKTLSGFTEGLSLVIDENSLSVMETKAAGSFPSYLMQHKKKLALGIFVAFVAVCAVYVFIYLLMTKVRDVNDLEARYDVDVIGTVPKKTDKSSAYKTLVIKLRHLSDDKICYIAGSSEKIPERLHSALDGQKAAVLVCKENAESTTDVIKDSGLYYVKPDFDAKSITDLFDFVIVYVVRSTDKSFALSLLEKAESCIFVETQYKSKFEDIENNIRDTQSIGVKVTGLISEEV